MTPPQKILLVTVTDVETQALLDAVSARCQQKFESKRAEDINYSFLGTIEKHTIFHVRCEMGSSTIGGSLPTLLRLFSALKPSAAIMLGIAGGLQPTKQKIGEIIVSERLYSYEPQRVGTEEVIHRGDKVPASTSLLRLAREAASAWRGARVHIGLLASGEKVVDNQRFADDLRGREPELLGVEMEGHGLFVAAYTNKVDWIVIKAISDFADGSKNTLRKHAHQKRAAANAAAFVLELIERIPKGSELSLVAQPSLPPPPPPIADRELAGLSPRERRELLGRQEDTRPGVCTFPTGPDDPYWARAIPAGKYPIAGGQARLTLPTIKIARYPVTVWQYRQFIEDAGYSTDRYWTPQGLAWRAAHGRPDTQALAAAPNYPMTAVSWYEAMAFCAWLNERHPPGPDWTICLPTEAEWEVAAMWDGSTMLRWSPGGATPRQNVKEAGLDGPAPVGLFPEGASPCGAYDMAGNIWEWCSSSYEGYPALAATPAYDQQPSRRDGALRGGAFYLPDAYSGWGARSRDYPIMRREFRGFRICLRQNGPSRDSDGPS